MAYQTYTLVLLNSESEDQRMLTSNKLHAGINKTDKAQKFILTLGTILSQKKKTNEHKISF